jgi:hypothetical protein
VYVPVESVKTEYRDKLVRDSIHILDSVYLYSRGDTVFWNKYTRVYINKYIRDTINRQDTIRVPYPVVNNIEVNRLKWWQEACCWFTGLISALLSIYIGLKYKSKIIAFFGKLFFKI